MTLSEIRRRRSCRSMTKTKSNRKPTVGTIRKSIAPMPDAWLRRKVFQICGRPHPGHVLGDRRLRDLDPKLKEFAVDAGSTPQPIGQAHLSDQSADLQRNSAALSNQATSTIQQAAAAFRSRSGANGSSARFVENAWITSSSLVRPTCVRSSRPMRATTIAGVPDLPVGLDVFIYASQGPHRLFRLARVSLGGCAWCRRASGQGWSPQWKAPRSKGAYP